MDLDTSDTPWCISTFMTLVSAAPDGSQLWRCGICGQLIKLVAASVTISSTMTFYGHYKPGREPVMVPEAFYKAFDGQS